MKRLLLVVLVLAGCAGKPAQTVSRTLVYSCTGVSTLVARETGEVLRLSLAGETRDLARERTKVGRLYKTDGLEFWIQGDAAELKIVDRAAYQCQLDPAASLWEDARLRGVNFRAAGNEPGWLIELSGDQLLYAGNYGRERLTFTGVRPVRDDHLVQTIIEAQSEGARLKLLLQLGDCRDSMCGELFSTRVTLTLNDKTYYGCGKNLN